MPRRADPTPSCALPQPAWPANLGAMRVFVGRRRKEDRLVHLQGPAGEATRWTCCTRLEASVAMENTPFDVVVLLVSLALFVGGAALRMVEQQQLQDKLTTVNVQLPLLRILMRKLIRHALAACSLPAVFSHRHRDACRPVGPRLARDQPVPSALLA